MKVIKRDGRAVDYDRAKIQIAIEKANKEVKHFFQHHNFRVSLPPPSIKIV